MKIHSFKIVLPALQMIALMLLGTMTVTADPTNSPNFALMGFAQTVTGGAGGAEVTATDYQSFSNYLRAAEPLIIHVQGSITGYTTEPYAYADGNNKTIIGDGTNAAFYGDLRVNGTNIIIRNMFLQHPTNDAITIDGGERGTGRWIWLDHCTFYNCGDGSADITKGADFVTISWCKFYYEPDNPHRYVHLLGSSDVEPQSLGRLHVTFHHNWYGDNCEQRMPSVRFGRAHVFNNYYDCPGNLYCVRTRLYAQVLAENNYFLQIHNPFERYINNDTAVEPASAHGLIRTVGNILVNCTTNASADSGFTTQIPAGNDTLSDFSPPPYPYVLDTADVIPNLAMHYAGSGKGPFDPFSQTPPTISIADAAVVEGNVGTTNMVFTITLSGPSTNPVALSYATTDGSAIAGSDYIGTNGFLVFPPGATSQTFSVTVIGNWVIESDETFFVTLYNPACGVFGDSQATGTIINDDGLPGDIYTFDWNTIGSPQYPNQTFSATVTAKDAFGTTVTNFTGPVVLRVSSGLNNMIEDFESGVWPHAPWISTTTAGYGTLSPTNAHESAYGLRDPNWIYRTDFDIGNPGDSLSWWVRPSSGTAGRAFLGFAMSDGTWWAAVAAPSSRQFIIQQSGVNMAFASQIWQSNKWYKVSVLFPSTTSVVCNLYDSDGVTLLNSLSYSGVTGLPGGVGMRAFGGFSVDTLTSGDAAGVIGLSPTNSGDFVNGVWTGDFTLVQPAKNVFLRANDPNGHFGNSNPFDVTVADDLSIRIADSPDPVPFGTNLTYLLVVSNTGPAAATGVLVTNILSSDVVFVSATASQGACTQADGIVTCDLGTVAGGAVATISVVATPISAGTTVIDLATVSRVESDPYPENNVSAAVTTITAAISIADGAVVEGNVGTTNLEFMVTLSAPSAQTISVHYTTGNGSAIAGSDYVSSSGALTFDPGNTTGTISIPVIGDTAIETNEFFSVTLSAPVNGVIDRSEAVGTILDDDGLPGDINTLEWSSISSPQYVSELFPVTLTARDGANNVATNFNGVVALSVFAGNGTAVSFNPSNSAGFVNGTWSGNITALEPATNLVLRADDGNGHAATSNPFDAALRNDISINITDSPDPISVRTNLTYTLTVSNAGPSAATGVTVTNFLPPGVTFVSAMVSQGSSFQSNGVVTCDLGTIPGETNATITIVAIPGTAGMTITNFAAVTRAEADPYLANNTATATTAISPATISILDVSLVEGNSGTTNMVFVVTLSSPGGQPVIVNFATTNGSATAGSDYIGTSGTLIFWSGITNQTITVVVNGDSVPEAYETLFVTLSNPVNGLLVRSRATGTIIDDDGVPGEIFNLEWNSIASPQFVNQPIATTLTARDTAHNRATSFNGTVALKGFAAGFTTNVILGDQTYSGWFYWYNTNVSHTMGYSFTPNSTLTVTHIRHYYGSKVSIWTDAGTLLFSTNITGVPETWAETELPTPLRLTAGNTYRVGILAPGPDVFYFYYQTTKVFAHGNLSKSYYGSGDTMPRYSLLDGYWMLVDLKYIADAVVPVAISPSSSGNFIDGTWSGIVTVPQSYSNLVLSADDGLGHFGLANPINVVAVPSVAMTPSGSSLLFRWPVEPSGFVLETCTNLASGYWSLATEIPLQIGDEYVVPIDMTGPQSFYHLRYVRP